MRGKGEREDDSLFSDDTQIFALDNSVVPFATMGMEKRMRTLFRPVHCGMTVGHLRGDTQAAPGLNDTIKAGAAAQGLARSWLSSLG